MSEEVGNRWPEIILINGLSVFGVMVVSEAAPALGGIAHELRLRSAPAIGSIMSMPALTAAVGALFIGWLVDRLGDRGLLIAGGVLAALGDVGTIASPSLIGLLVWRVVGGLGYACMAVSSVAMVARITRGRQRTAALALWSTVIPMSFVVAFLTAAVLPVAAQWRWSFGVHASVTLLLVVAGFIWLPRRDAGERIVSRTAGVGEVLRSPWPYLLGASFAANAFLQTGMVAAVPHLLALRIGVAEGQVQPFIILAMICNMAGAFAAGGLMNRGVSAWMIGAGGTLICALCALGMIFAPMSLAAGVALNCGLLGGCGLLVGLWALLPLVAPSARSFGATSGILTQITLVGVLFGPPVALGSLAGGPSGLIIYLAIALLGCLLGLPIWLRRRPGASASVAAGAADLA